MIGIDRDTGATVDDWLQFVQRATRALTTPLGTRQKRPLYGSLIPTLLGQNLGSPTAHREAETAKAHRG